MCVKGCTRPNGAVCNFYLTAACNLRCAYCYERGKSPVPDLTPERIADCFDRLRCQQVPVGSFVLFGGEPCLRWDLVFRVARASHAYEFLLPDPGIILFTNGLLLTAQRIEELKEESIQLLISFDGYDERSALRYGGRLATLAAHVETVIASAIRTSVPTTVVFTVGRHNADYLLDDMSRLHDQHGVGSFSVVIIRQSDFAAQHLAETRDAVLQWARSGDIDMDWKPVGQHGSPYETYFFSACHVRHLYPAEWGTWARSGW